MPDSGARAKEVVSLAKSPGEEQHAAPGSLRDALTTTPAGGTVDFEPFLSGGAITLTSGALAITKDIAIAFYPPGPITVSGFELKRWRLVAGIRRDHEPPPGVDNVICPIEVELDPMGGCKRSSPFQITLSETRAHGS
jgi:hypothetical protein